MAANPRFHPGADSIAVAFCADQFQSQPMVAEALIVAQKQRWTADLSQHDVQVAIPINVRKRGATAYDRLEKIRAAFGLGHGFKTHALFVAAIPEQLSGLTILLERIDAVYFRFQMAIGGENVQPAIEVVIEKEQAELQQFLAPGPDALLDGFIRKNERVALRDIKRIHLVGEVADGNAQAVVISEAGGIDAHGAAGQAVGVVGHARAGADFLEAGVVLVTKQKILHRVIGDHEINPAVIVHIHRRHRQRFGHGQAGRRVFNLNARFRGHVAEPAVAFGMIEVRESALELARRSIGSADLRQLEAGAAIQLRGPTDIIAHEQVEFAVAVKINPRGTRAPSVRRAANPGGLCYLAELSPPFIMEEMIPANAGDEN